MPDPISGSSPTNPLDNGNSSMGEPVKELPVQLPEVGGKARTARTEQGDRLSGEVIERIFPRLSLECQFRIQLLTKYMKGGNHG